MRDEVVKRRPRRRIDGDTMPSYPFVTLDVFTNVRFGGNPLAVFPDASGLDGEQMQALAREFNLSETTFVLPAKDPTNTAWVRIFTPQAELPFAGHPNVGTGWVLAGLGRDRDGMMRFEEAAGLVEVVAQRRGADLESCRIAAPQVLSVEDAPPADDLAACAGLAPGETSAAVVASVGAPFVFASVSAAALGRAMPDPAAFRATAARWPALPGGFALCLHSREPDGSVRARVFAPFHGINEDPATGSAATALGALLLHREGGDRLAFDLHQGVEMGRPSLLKVEAARTVEGIRAWVAGTCVPVLRGDAQV
jgi:trans-2,3-dihydro-3-hydroxyanthranilate isomerase